jgi:hypothetical protein
MVKFLLQCFSYISLAILVPKHNLPIHQQCVGKKTKDKKLFSHHHKLKAKCSKIKEEISLFGQFTAKLYKIKTNKEINKESNST